MNVGEIIHVLVARRRLAVGGLALVVAAALVFGAAYAYARSQEDVIPKGIHAGTIDLGGLSADATRVKLERVYRPLQRPLVLRYPRGRYVLTARETQVKAETGAVVARALELSRRSWFVARAWRDVAGATKANLPVRVDYSHPAVEHTIQELQRRIDRPPRNAVLRPSFDRLLVGRSRPGVAVAATLLRREIVRTCVHRGHRACSTCRSAVCAHG
jgi:Putative peptidoglycan binding domain